MSVIKFSNDDEAIKFANNSLYGLGAGVITQNIERYIKFANELRCGTIFVNCYNIFDSCLPFGGFKNSGMGREMGQ